MLKVVFDTNVFISAFYLPESIPAEVILLARRNKVVNFISPQILREVERIMTEKLLWDKSGTQSALQRIENFSEVIHPHEYLTVLADDPGNRILECAIQAKVDFIVSGDRHLLNLKNYHRIETVTPADFLKRFPLA